MIARVRSTAALVSPLSADQLEAGADRRQRIAQLVGEHGQELVLAAIGLGELLLALAQRHFRALAVVDVGHDAGEPDGAPRHPVERRARRDREPAHRAVRPAHADVLVQRAGPRGIDGAGDRRHAARPVVGIGHGVAHLGEGRARAAQAEQFERARIRLATVRIEMPDEGAHPRGLERQQPRVAVVPGLGGGRFVDARAHATRWRPIGDVVGHEQRRRDAAGGVVERDPSRQIGAAAGLVLAGERLSVEGQPAMRLQPRRQRRIEDLGERPSGDLRRPEVGEGDGVAVGDEAAQRRIRRRRRVRRRDSPAVP